MFMYFINRKKKSQYFLNIYLDFLKCYFENKLFENPLDSPIIAILTDIFNIYLFRKEYSSPKHKLAVHLIFKEVTNAQNRC